MERIGEDSSRGWVTVEFHMRYHSYILLQLGDTSLPIDQPEMIDDELLKNLHHVLFEARALLPP